MITLEVCCLSGRANSTTKIDDPAVTDVPHVDETVFYKTETVPKRKPVRATVPVRTFTDAARHYCDRIQPSGPIDRSADEKHNFPPVSGLREAFGGEVQTPPFFLYDQFPPAEDDGSTIHNGRGRGFRGERRGLKGGYRGGDPRGHRGRGEGKDRKYMHVAVEVDV